MYVRGGGDEAQENGTRKKRIDISPKAGEMCDNDEIIGLEVKVGFGVAKASPGLQEVIAGGLEMWQRT